MTNLLAKRAMTAVIALGIATGASAVAPATAFAASHPHKAVATSHTHKTTAMACDKAMVGKTKKSGKATLVCDKSGKSYKWVKKAKK